MSQQNILQCGLLPYFKMCAARKAAIREMELAGNALFEYRDATGRDAYELLETYPGYHIDDARDMCALVLGIRDVADNVTMEQIERFTTSLRRALEETKKYNKKPIRPLPPQPDKWPNTDPNEIH